MQQTSTPISLLLEQAKSQLNVGNDEQAKSLYLAVLTQNDRQPEALLGIARIALGQGYKQAARSALHRMLNDYPDHIEALILFGHILLLDHQPEAALYYFDNAVQHAPVSFPALQGMAQTLRQLGKVDEADAILIRAAQCTDAIIHLPYRGIGNAPKVLLLLSLQQGNIPTRHFLNDRLVHLIALHVESWSPDQSLPDCDVLFNAIGDADLCTQALQRCSLILQQKNRTAINPPWHVVCTGRMQINALAQTIKNIVVPEISMVTVPQLQQIKAIHSPFLLRVPGYHGGDFFERIDSMEQLQQVIKIFPSVPLYKISVLPCQHADGLYRKFRVIWIGGQLFPIHLAVSQHWKVHYMHSLMHESVRFRQEEAIFLEDMTGTLRAKAVQALNQLLQPLQLDYVGADFTLDEDGRVLLFECNPTMLIPVPSTDSIWDYRRPSFFRTLHACNQLIGSKHSIPTH